MNKTPNLSTERGINERQIRDMKQSVDSCGQLDFFFLKQIQHNSNRNLKVKSHKITKMN